MKHLILISLAWLFFAGCGQDEADPLSTVKALPSMARAFRSAKDLPTLAEARRGFQTRLAEEQAAAEPVPDPPEEIFRLIRYDSPAGKLAAYLSPNPGDGKKHPAIVWITGGDCNSIGELWEDKPRDNDQTAAAYRKAGIILMLPSLRGGNDNPGRREGFFGEVDDVLAATEHLAHQEYVDPERIYLGGHSTGGTMVMLVAESSNRFRGTFSFGPADDVRGYGPEYLPFNASDPKEVELRSPGHWLSSVRSPLFVFEGTDAPSNMDSLQSMAQAPKNSWIHFLPVKGVNHFSILAPVNEVIATKILRDTGSATNISFSEADLDAIRNH